MCWDRILIGFQVFLLALIIFLEMHRRQGKNLIAILLFGTSLILVQFQAWYIAGDLETSDWVVYLNNIITREGFKLANLLVFISVVISFTVYLTLPVKRAPVLHKMNVGHALREFSLPYMVVGLLVLTSAALLFHLLGGLHGVLSAPGRMVGGQTLLLTIIQLGKMPLLHKIATKRSPIILDWALMGVSMLIVMFNSRFLTIYMIVQYLVLYHYCIREISLKQFLIFGGLATAVILGYGSLRHYTNFYTTYTLENILRYFREGTSGEGFNFIAFFYRHNVEGFSGFAGIITAYIEQRGMAHDFGLYNLSLFTQLIPYALRQAAFGDIVNTLEAIYPYHGSVVAPGYENAFAHFGFPGVVMFALLLAFLPRWMHYKLISERRDKLIYGILAPHILTLIRGTFRNVLFFGLADLCLVILYRIILTGCRDVMYRYMHYETPQ